MCVGPWVFKECVSACGVGGVGVELQGPEDNTGFLRDDGATIGCELSNVNDGHPT